MSCAATPESRTPARRGSTRWGWAHGDGQPSRSRPKGLESRHSKADLCQQQQDWFLKCLQGGRAQEVDGLWEAVKDAGLESSNFQLHLGSRAINIRAKGVPGQPSQPSVLINRGVLCGTILEQLVRRQPTESGPGGRWKRPWHNSKRAQLQLRFQFRATRRCATCVTADPRARHTGGQTR
jgi:hypothetical protein